MDTTTDQAAARERYGAHRSTINAELTNAATALDEAAADLDRRVPGGSWGGTRPDTETRVRIVHLRLSASDIRDLLAELRVTVRSERGELAGT